MWGGAKAGSDTTIAVVMVYYVSLKLKNALLELYHIVKDYSDCLLRKLRKRDSVFQETHNIVKRLVRLTIETGLVTGQISVATFRR